MLFARRFQAFWTAVAGWVEATLSKGRKKPSLRDLSTTHDLDPHIQDIVTELNEQSDRGAALVAAAIVDAAVARLLRCRIAAYKDCEEILFWKEGAPLSTFSDRIKIARAVGCIGPMIEGHLDTVRRIRNQFAHSPLRIDFTHKLIAAEIEKLLPDNPDWKPEWSQQRRRYVGTVAVMTQALEATSQQHLQDKVDIWMN